MHRGASTRKTATPKQTQAKAHPKQSKRTLTTTKSLKSTSSISNTTSASSILSKSRKNMSTSPILTVDEAKAKGLSHEQGFDQALDELGSKLSSTDDPLTLIKQQNKINSAQNTRDWTVQDTLTVIPHVLRLLQPDGVFPKLAQHRISNLKAQLYQKNQQRIAEEQKKLDEHEFQKAEVQRLKWINENSIDLIPLQDYVRVHMQVCLSAVQYVLMSYQNYCKNTFVFDSTGQQFYSQLLEHLETVPQLTFYRIHFHQSLSQLSSTLTGKTHEQVVESMSKMDSNAMQEIFLKRYAFARSNAFRDSLKKGFKEENVLSDSTMLPIGDPVNAGKQNVINQICHQAHIAISRQAGLDTLGHMLLEVELAMGIRYPNGPKHILHVKNLYTMTKIAKMPQNKKLESDYFRIMNQLQTPQDLLSSKDPEDTIKDDAADASNFIQLMEELPVQFPDDLWEVPVLRSERLKYFQENPEAHQLWTIYSKVINSLDTINRLSDVHTQYLEQIDVLEKQHAKPALTDAQKADIDNKLSIRRQKIVELDESIEKEYDIVKVLDNEYESKAVLFRSKMGIPSPRQDEQAAKQ